MARIVELKQYDNVTLGQGVMQNWVDLDVDGPSWHPLIAELTKEVRGRVLVVGPHDPALLEDLAGRVDELVVVIRSAPDAGTIATRVPIAHVRAGSLAHAVEQGETFDAVIALDDLYRVLSAEEGDRTWAELAAEVSRCAAPDAPVLLAVENERGLHRSVTSIDSYAMNLDRDWTPFRTWDASRPRTPEQVASFVRESGRGAVVWGFLPAWRRVDVLTSGASGSSSLRDFAAAYALRGGASPIPWRSAALADRIDDVAAGWVVVLGGASEPAARTVDSAGNTSDWTVAQGVSRRSDGHEFRIPAGGRTALIELIEAAGDSDTPTMRRVLKQWYARLQEVAVNGVVPARYADARLRNVFVKDDEVVFLEAAAADARLEDVVWAALSDLLGTIMGHGLKHPWPTAMNRQTRLAALGAMAGAPRPDDLQRWVGRVADQGQTREELLAVIKRQQDELKSTWARLRWDEKQYATFVAKSNVQKGVRYAKKQGKNLPKDAARRVVKKIRK